MYWRSYLFVFYMLAALIWWAVQLWGMNDALTDTRHKLLELKYNRQGQGVNLSELEQTAEYKLLQAEWERRRRMVWMEGLVFSILLLYGWMAFHRYTRKEVALARQRRNFLLSITHELKSPIASQRLVLETLLRRSNELTGPQIAQLCSSGLREAARLQSLVEDLLLAARLEDNWQPHHEAVQLKNLLHDSVNALKVRFPQARIEVNIPEHFPTLQADRAGIIAVINNLLENAIKYSPEASLIRFTAEYSNGHALLRVADQGNGIPDNEKEAVFEKFYRLGNEETRQATGTGLGLYIARQVVRAHGGTVEISDNHPKGTVFTIRL